MSTKEDLEKRVKGAGVDLEFIRQVNKLEEIKKLVEQGKVKEEVYKQLEDSVFKVKQEQQKTTKPRGKKGPSALNGIKNKLAAMRPPKKTPTDSLKSEGAPTKRTKSRGFSFRGRTETATSMSTVGSRREKASDNQLVKGELMKWVKKKKKTGWKTIEVVLYANRLEFLNRGEVVKTFPLTDDHFVSVVNQGIVERAKHANEAEDMDAETNSEDEELDANAELMTNSIAKSEEMLAKSHVFVIASLKGAKIYLACDSEQTRSLWVAMTVEVIRDLRNSAGEDSGFMGSARKVKNKLWDNYEKKKAKYVQHRLGRKMDNNLEGLEADDIESDVKTWNKQGNKLAANAVVSEWKNGEAAAVNEMKKETEHLKRKLNEKTKELVQYKEKTAEELKKIKEENEKKLEEEKMKNMDLNQKYDDLMEKYRAEALQRNQERKNDEERIMKRIKALQRRSVLPHSGSEEAQHYKEELEKFKMKLATLQKALNVDLDEMDWDGTLEQAEERMQECLKNILEGETPVIQAKAQQDFDKWDQLVRGHQDYISREENKWNAWEEENHPKNLAARDEMREKYVPEIFAVGCSVEQLMEIKGIKKKTAKRIWKNKIFQFLWKDEDSISRIHPAALTNDYASQGLDIRELRAVYACLPKEFSNDNDGRKKMFKETMRSRLSNLSEKEKKGTLSPPEEMHNDYRDKAVAAFKAPKNMPKVKRQKNTNSKMAERAKALGDFFAAQQGGGSGPPKKKPAAAKPGAKAAPKASAEIDPDSPEFSKFFKMQKMNLPDGAIEQKMASDGFDISLWKKLKEAKANGTKVAPQSSKPAGVNPDDDKWKPYFRMKKMGLEDGAIQNKMIKDGVDPAEWQKVLAKKSGGAPAKKKKEALNPDDPIWADYWKMKRVGLGEGQILNKMQKDGRDPALWSKLVEMKEKQKKKTTKGAPAVPKSLSPFDFAEMPVQKKKDEKVLKTSETTVSGGSDEKNKAEGSTEADVKNALKNLKRRSKTEKAHDGLNGEVRKKRKKKKSKRVSATELGDDEAGELKKKVTRRHTRKQGSKSGTHLLQGDTGALVKKAQFDVGDLDLDSVKRGSHAFGIMEYGENIGKNGSKRSSVHNGGRRKTLRQSKVGTGALQTDTALMEVIDYIMTDGVFEQVEGGVRTMKFGDVYDNFIEISDILIGLLLKGKKAGQIKYKGDMLFKGIHDEVKITVV